MRARAPGARYSLAALVEDLHDSYQADAIRQAIGLLIEARDRNMPHERDVFTAAAIMLCRHARQKAERR